ncbi:restriction endonuclease subunit S [Mycoplasmopsis felis]|uniref:restriction endonuclease subunit S n=1 Tax=Mycoplasmopsis felis TaxID=33923 RepID=UPI002DD44947|nr:restriction endonuclease subunit S [Mycoplasmopsis felis]WRX06591.1 restriction endonuclease subunit S [Mycoplasmopsis felis]
MKKVLVPRVRFKGFSEEWKEEKFGELLFRINEKGYEFLETLTASKSGEMLKRKSINYHIQVAKESLKNYNRVLKNDFVLHLSTYESGLAYSKEIGITSPAYDVLRFFDKNNNDPIFFKYVFSNKKFINSLVPFTYGLRQGKSINLEELNKSLIEKTNVSEQQKIGKLLENIDNLITLEEIKLNKLKQLKETLLQKMFPEHNSKIPRIRFKGFEEEWKEERLEEIGQTYTGLSGKTKKDFGHGNSRYITYLNIFNNPIANLKGLDRIEKDCKQNSVKYGDIFVTTSSEIPEEVGMTSIWPFKDKENIYLNSFCFGIRLNNINNYYINFLAYNLRNNELRKDIVLLAQGISRFNISNRRFMKLNILLPNISEQQKIGDFFSKIDILINLYNSKLNKLKQIKESLLQKMFV